MAFNMSDTQPGTGRIIRAGLQAWPGRSCFKETDFGLSFGAVESWTKVKNPEAPAATRAADGTF